MNEGNTSTSNYWTRGPCNSLRSTLTMLVVSKETVALCEEQTGELEQVSHKNLGELEQVSHKNLGELQREPHLKRGKWEQVLLQHLEEEALPKWWDSMGQDPESIAVIPDLEKRKRGINGPTDFPLLPPQRLNGEVRMLPTP